MVPGGKYLRTNPVKSSVSWDKIHGKKYTQKKYQWTKWETQKLHLFTKAHWTQQFWSCSARKMCCSAEKKLGHRHSLQILIGKAPHLPTGLSQSQLWQFWCVLLSQVEQASQRFLWPVKTKNNLVQNFQTWSQQWYKIICASFKSLCGQWFCHWVVENHDECINAGCQGRRFARTLGISVAHVDGPYLVHSVWRHSE